MTGILGALPPGLQGYVAGQQMDQQRQSNQLGMLGQMSQMKSVELQQQEMQRKIAEAQERKGILAKYATSLPEEQRNEFMLDPGKFIEARNKTEKLRPDEGLYRNGQLVTQAPAAAYNLNPGQMRMQGNQPIAQAPHTPTMQQLPVPGQPGVYQPTWMTPGAPTGTAVGGMKAPEILNNDVFARKLQLGATSAPKTNISVNTGKKFGEAMGIGMGESIPKLRDEARGALQSIDAAHQVLGALDSGQVIARCASGKHARILWAASCRTNT